VLPLAIDAHDFIGPLRARGDFPPIGISRADFAIRNQIAPIRLSKPLARDLTFTSRDRAFVA
jgi:hypothetical protein